jgi:cytochrome c-type biogenesis protein
MSRPLRAILAAVATVAIAAGCVAAPSTQASPAAFRAEDLESGAGVSLVDLRGRPALLTSWAVWCTACIEELPALQAYWMANGDRLQIVAVNVDSGRQVALRRARQDHLTMPVWHDPGNAFSRVFGLYGIPSWALVDPFGRIVEVGAGPIDPTTDSFQQLLRTVPSASP